MAKGLFLAIAVALVAHVAWQWNYNLDAARMIISIAQGTPPRPLVSARRGYPVPFHGGKK